MTQANHEGTCFSFKWEQSNQREDQTQINFWLEWEILGWELALAAAWQGRIIRACRKVEETRIFGGPF